MKVNILFIFFNLIVLKTSKVVKILINGKFPTNN
jgi:hypothetical protein